MSARFERSRRICCVVPDTGVDRTLIRALREERGVVTTTTATCRGIGALQGLRSGEPPGRRGQLPPSQLVHLIEVVAPDEQAYELFDYIYQTAGIGREGGGVIWMSTIIQATAYALPSGVEEERGE